MPRNATVRELQDMQRGTRHVGLGELEASGDGAPSNGQAAERDPISGDLIDGVTTISEAIRSLNVEAVCTAEMSLHMITNKVREATSWAKGGLRPTEAEIVAEAERIWTGFTDQRKGPRTYAVDPSGQVRDWRRPDPGPAANTDPVEPEPHVITDENAQQASLFLVPSDSAFNGKLYRDAPELANIAERLIGSKEYFSHLLHCQIRYAWKSKSGTTKRRRQTGGLKRGSDWFGQLLNADFGIWLAADTARERHFSDRHVERYLTHQLLRIGQDEHGNFVEQAPTLQVFAPEITEYADVADDDDRIGRNAFRAAEQMGLFEDEPADPDAEYDDERVGETVL